ncbi:MAG TPA: MFS transporter [Nevskiaceae bacterium]|nr:MFS transporter [Nevskiaceae bacterium]
MSQTSPRYALAVAAAALGYFVDLYDIVIFGVVRVASLTELGITGEANTAWGIHLLNLQMIGMLIGGFFWGWVGDRYGRRFALIATITLYSLANIANAFVVTVEQYALLRLLAGIGLAGELGAGVTLIAETLPARLRGYGTTVIAFLGLCGALTASLTGGELHWRWAYGLGGGLGLLVLALRMVVLEESETYRASRESGPPAWRVHLLNAPTLRRFAAVTLVGVPIWYASALFVNLAPEYGRLLGFSAPLTVAQVLMWQAVGLALGSAATGLIGEWLRSRRRVIFVCLWALAAFVVLLLESRSAAGYCAVLFLIGLAQGYWTVFITLSAEQFRTEVRATVATSVPNLVRAAVVPVTLGLQALLPLLGLKTATLAIGALVIGAALVCLYRLPETWGQALDQRPPG